MSVCFASDFGLIRMPLELHWKLLGRVPPGGALVGGGVVGGGVVGGALVGGGALDVCVGGGVLVPPVQVVAFSAKLDGTGSLVVQDPLNPKLGAGVGGYRGVVAHVADGHRRTRLRV
jgi:hypothetical protein